MVDIVGMGPIYLLCLACLGLSFVEATWGQVWGFGQDTYDAEVIAHEYGHMSFVEKTKDITFVVPKCYDLVYIRVEVRNILSTPTVTFKDDTNTVTISYKLFQNSDSTYDVVAKGTLNPSCYTGSDPVSQDLIFYGVEFVSDYNTRRYGSGKQAINKKPSHKPEHHHGVPSYKPGSHYSQPSHKPGHLYNVPSHKTESYTSEQFNNPGSYNNIASHKPESYSGVPYYKSESYNNVESNKREHHYGIPSYKPESNSNVPCHKSDRLYGIPSHQPEHQDDLPSYQPERHYHIPSYKPGNYYDVSYYKTEINNVPSHKPERYSNVPSQKPGSSYKVPYYNTGIVNLPSHKSENYYEEPSYKEELYQTPSYSPILAKKPYNYIPDSYYNLLGYQPHDRQAYKPQDNSGLSEYKSYETNYYPQRHHSSYFPYKESRRHSDLP